MQTSASAGSLALGKNLGKPRSLVQKGSWQARSSPALAAAFSLRQYAIDHKHILGEKPGSPANNLLAENIPIEHIDLKGGNGKWRMLKAEDHFARLKVEEEERKRQDIIREHEKKRRLAELADRRRRQAEEEERRWQEERDQKQREEAERKARKREREEAERLKREAEEAERLRRLPKECQTCGGGGKCQECMGNGYTFQVFLVHQVDAVPGLLSAKGFEHGRKHQGCDRCGGYSHNMLGELKLGTGLCVPCSGTGKIWPVIDDSGISPKVKSVQGYQENRLSDLKLG